MGRKMLLGTDITKQLNQPPTPATNEEVIPTTEDFRDNVEATKAADEAVFLDPLNSPRQYWREPFTGIQREIWRPGTTPSASKHKRRHATDFDHR